MNHKLRHFIQHPMTEHNQGKKNCDNFRNKGQCLLLNGGDCLKDTDNQADNQ